jgi:hypothetical protein
MNNVLKPSLVQKYTRMKVYKTLARFMLTYKSDAWTIFKRDESSVTAAEQQTALVWTLKGI